MERCEGRKTLRRQVERRVSSCGVEVLGKILRGPVRWSVRGFEGLLEAPVPFLHRRQVYEKLLRVCLEEVHRRKPLRRVSGPRAAMSWRQIFL